eukprot:s221_g4.t1
MKRGRSPAVDGCLHVWKASGERAASIPMEDLVDVRSLKQNLGRRCGLPRFRQRLLRNGRVLPEEECLESPGDVQLVLLPFCSVHDEEIRQFIGLSAAGRAAEVEAKLQLPLDPNNRANGLSALLSASDGGHLHVVQLLLEARADADVAGNQGMTPLISASAQGHVDVVRVLLEAGARKDAANIQGKTALLTAALNRQLETVTLLLEFGANKNCADVEGITPLIAAARSGHLGIARRLTDARADMRMADRIGWNAFVWAASAGHKEMVTFLAEAGVDADMVGRHGDAAFWWACSAGKQDVAQLLLEFGVDKNSCDSDGDSALHAATGSGHAPVVRLLLNAGVDKNHANSRGQTALHMPAASGNLAILRLLLNAGADKNAADISGATPFQVASSRAAKDLLSQEQGVPLELHIVGVIPTKWARYFNVKFILNGSIPLPLYQPEVVDVTAEFTENLNVTLGIFGIRQKEGGLNMGILDYLPICLDPPARGCFRLTHRIFDDGKWNEYNFKDLMWWRRNTVREGLSESNYPFGDWNATEGPWPAFEWYGFRMVPEAGCVLVKPSDPGERYLGPWAQYTFPQKEYSLEELSFCTTGQSCTDVPVAPSPRYLHTAVLYYTWDFEQHAHKYLCDAKPECGPDCLANLTCLGGNSYYDNNFYFRSSTFEPASLVLG